jgi:hypothetical protein
VKPEHAQKELPEGVEHLDEEIPPQTHIRSQIGDQQMEAISGGHEFPEVPSDKV